MVSPTPNKGYTYPAHGGAVNAWDSPLNANFDQIDLNVAGYYPIAAGSATPGEVYNSSNATISSTVSVATFPAANAQNLYYQVTGTLTKDLTLTFPSAGGIYDVYNNTSGNFTLTAVTAASTSGGTAITQGGRTLLVSDGTNLVQADTNSLAKLKSYLGNPNGNVSGNVATANGTATDAIWDVTDQQLYLCTTSGSSVTAVWTAQIPRITPQGYLTLSTDPLNVVLSADALSQTTVNYYPFVGGWVPMTTNGTTIFPYQFSSFALTLTGSQAANTIYDVFLFWNAGSPLIGTGPAWATSTAGSGSRGSGAGTTQLARLQGLWVNAVAINITNGGAPTAVPANQGIYLGSIHIDAAAGQVTCHRNFGQNRKFGVWNAYNRMTIELKCGTGTASWTPTTGAARATNNEPAAWTSNALNFGSGTACNGGNVLDGLQEEILQGTYIQDITFSGGAGGASQWSAGIGVNSVTTVSGTNAATNAISVAANYNGGSQSITKLMRVPTLGLMTYLAMEGGSNNNSTFFGTETRTGLYLTWRG